MRYPSGDLADSSEHRFPGHRQLSGEGALPRVAHVAEDATTATIGQVLELEFDPVGSLHQNLRCYPLPHSHVGCHAMLGEPVHDMVGVDPLHAQPYMRTKRFWTVSFDQGEVLRSGPYPENGDRRSSVSSCPWSPFELLVRLNLHIGQLLIPLNLVLCSQSLFRFADLGDDGLCRGGPDKGCGVIVSAIDVVVDRLD